MKKLVKFLGIFLICVIGYEINNRLAIGGMTDPGSFWLVGIITAGVSNSCYYIIKEIIEDK